MQTNDNYPTRHTHQMDTEEAFNAALQGPVLSEFQRNYIKAAEGLPTAPAAKPFEVALGQVPTASTVDYKNDRSS